MTPNELRALAVQLEASYYGKPARNAADYLRACADAKPVGYATANGMRMLQQDDATVLLYKHDYLIRPDHVPLYAHPAPAVPQAEPIDPHMIVAEDRFPDEQAEPKREPVGTLTIRDDMGAEITFHRSFTMRPRQTFAIYPNWDLLTPIYDGAHELEAQETRANARLIAACSPENIAAILAHVEAQASEIKRLRELLCKCDMRTRLVGDGCEFCNPQLAEELAKEQR